MGFWQLEGIEYDKTLTFLDAFDSFLWQRFIKSIQGVWYQSKSFRLTELKFTIAKC